MTWRDVPRRLTWRQWTLLATPVALVATTLVTFQWLDARFGSVGYLGGFVFYWVGWCLAVPTALLGPAGVRDLFRAGRPPLGSRPQLTAVALVWLLPFPFLFYFLPNVAGASAAALVASLVVGVVIGVTEELLWRGTFVRVFPDSRWLGYVHPTVWFALWHVAPQSVRPSPVPGGVAAFVLYALLLGASYGYHARQTGSIRWCTVAHVVHDTLGLPGATFLGLAGAL
ncbi:CPBP family intramembrane metalloprotease [Salinirubellus salinus]|uniref:CPBP family intramembrane metalloprotease n=1 Tax=Salinirubellus salinus TaxID=1364945 RepID=A0A9E7R1R5_9EURY|nr:CPBP family intramembrane glutamic endopeptidase [Salinirubellus salinus]UWM54042.1 CPBP family intramembrane metalloprotease [Salinirubellus salinus]